MKTVKHHPLTSNAIKRHLAARLPDDLVLTMLPAMLGEGLPLADTTVKRTDLTVLNVAKHGDGFV